MVTVGSPGMYGTCPSCMATPCQCAIYYPSVGVPTKTTKDINWKEYVPARPPIDGSYLVVYITGIGKKHVCNADYSAKERKWYDQSSIRNELHVTHYVKVGLP